MRPEIAVWRPALAGPAAFGGILDQLLSGLEAVSQPGPVFAGGEELRAAQGEIALAGAFGGVRGQRPSSSSVLKKLVFSRSSMS